MNNHIIPDLIMFAILIASTLLDHSLWLYLVGQFLLAQTNAYQ